MVLGLIAVACGGGSAPTIENPRIGQPTGPNAALYFTVKGYNQSDRLIGATTDVATQASIHETVMKDDGTMGMQPVGALDLPANGTLVLEPGGYHIMLMDVERLDVGETVIIALQWENYGEQQIEAEVVHPADTAID